MAGDVDCDTEQRAVRKCQPGHPDAVDVKIRKLLTLEIQERCQAWVRVPQKAQEDKIDMLVVIAIHVTDIHVHVSLLNTIARKNGHAVHGPRSCT